MFRPFIIAVSVFERECLVIGSGPEAAARANALLSCGARVTILANSLCAELRELHETGRLSWVARAFEPHDIDNKWLIVLVDRNAELAARVGRAADAARILFCAVDQPEYGNFTHLALARASDLAIAVSTSGRIPGLARRLREELERLFGTARFQAFFERLARARAETSGEQRRELFERVLGKVRFTGQLELPDDDAF